MYLLLNVFVSLPQKDNIKRKQFFGNMWFTVADLCYAVEEDIAITLESKAQLFSLHRLSQPVSCHNSPRLSQQ
jgi:hypothetical protein